MGNRAPLIIVLLLYVSACFSASAAERNIEKTFKVKLGGTLSLNTDMGTIDINSHSDDSVLVRVELVTYNSSGLKGKELFDDFKLTFNNTGKDVSIKGDSNQNWLWRNNWLHVHFIITVPKRYNLDVNTAGGHIAVGNITGHVTLNTSGGKIKLGDVTGNVIAKTSGGRIKIDKVKGDLDVRTSGGRIDIKGVEGNLKASTSGGPIRAKILKQVSNPVNLYTSGGSIKLTVPADFKANLNASTSGGSIYTDFPVTVTGRITTSSLHGPINGGGPDVVLRTSGGNIEISKSAL